MNARISLHASHKLTIFSYIHDDISISSVSPVTKNLLWCILLLLLAEIEWDGSGWLKGNAGHTGFYRVNYAQQQWDQIIKQLETDHKVSDSDGNTHRIVIPVN